MIVMRYTFQIKPGKVIEALELAKAGRRDVWPSITSRILTSRIGSMNTIEFENEHKDLTEWEKISGEIGETEQWGPWVTKWVEVISGEGTNEVLNIE